MPEPLEVEHSVGWKRIYEPALPSDGIRILVDRLWPRGMKKEDLQIDFWMKEIAPSSALRKWFGHDPGRWEEFHRRYTAELKARPDLVESCLEKVRDTSITLLTAAKNRQYNHAILLVGYLRHRSTILS